MKTIEADKKTVDRLVWAIEKGAPFDLGEFLTEGETFVIVYPGTKSVVCITKNGMASLDEKRQIVHELHANNMERPWWPSALMLYGFLPLCLRVIRVMPNNDAIFEIRR